MIGIFVSIDCIDYVAGLMFLEDGSIGLYEIFAVGLKEGSGKHLQA